MHACYTCVGVGVCVCGRVCLCVHVHVYLNCYDLAFWNVDYKFDSFLVCVSLHNFLDIVSLCIAQQQQYQFH